MARTVTISEILVPALIGGSGGAGEGGGIAPSLPDAMMISRSPASWATTPMVTDAVPTDTLASMFQAFRTIFSRVGGFALAIGGTEGNPTIAKLR